VEPRTLLLATAVAGVLLAQEPRFTIVKGEVLRVEAGRLHIADRRQHVVVCRVDDGTHFIRQGQRITFNEIEPGNLIEAIVERPAESSCVLHTVYVLARSALPPPDDELLRLLDRQRNLLENWLPRGNLTFAGTIVRVEDSTLVLRTRNGQIQRLRLREDTRYTHQGLPADRSMLQPNLRVFVRAGRDFRGVLEAYQVMAGQILQP